MLYAIVMIRKSGMLVTENLPPGLGRIIARKSADLLGLMEATSNSGRRAASGMSLDWPKAGQTPSARLTRAKARSMASFLLEYRAHCTAKSEEIRRESQRIRWDFGKHPCAIAGHVWFRRY